MSRRGSAAERGERQEARKRRGLANDIRFAAPFGEFGFDGVETFGSPAVPRSPFALVGELALDSLEIVFAVDDLLLGILEVTLEAADPLRERGLL